MANEQTSTEPDLVVDLNAPEAAAGPDAYTSALGLAAAHFILSPNRQKTENEILGATILEALRAGPLTLEDLATRCQQMWPGSGITMQQVEVAVETARSAGWVVDTVDAQRRARVWGHTGEVIPDLEEAQEWARDVIIQTASQLRDATRDAGFQVAHDQLGLWLDILWGAICSGAAEGAQVFSGGITKLSDGSLTPAVFDMGAARRYVAERSTDPTAQDFLCSMVAAAIDQGDVFGNELVSVVCAAYLLHAFLARRDVPKARRDVGTIAGRRIVIDTPWLITICGSRRALTAFCSTIEAAKAAGLEVIVAEHTIEELREVVDRAEGEIRGIAAEIAKGLDPELLAASLPGDQSLVAVWLAYAIEAHDFDWASFHQRVDLIVSVVIPDCGVVVRPHGNDQDDEIARVEQAVAALTNALGESGAGRGAEQIRRDANTIVLASRPRRTRRVSGDLWPMGWVVTRDRHMNPAYQRLLGKAEASLILSPSQFVYLLALGASAKREKDLAVAASDVFVREASLAIAVQWPPGMLFEIARSLHPDAGITITDVRLSQRSFDDLLKEQPDILNDPREAGARLVALTVAERGRRLEGVRNHRLTQATHRAKNAEAELSMQRESAKGERREKAQVEDALRREKVDRQSESRLWRRKSIVRMLLAALGVASLWAATAAEWWVVVGMVATGVLLWLSSRTWTRDVSTGWHEMLVSLLGLLPLLEPFLDDVRRILGI